FIFKIIFTFYILYQSVGVAIFKQKTASLFSTAYLNQTEIKRNYNRLQPMKFIFRFLILLFLISPSQLFANDVKKAPDREYTLRATMLGYFDESGTRNPVLRAQKGETVKITIINGEPLTHDIALEKAGIIS